MQTTTSRNDVFQVKVAALADVIASGSPAAFLAFGDWLEENGLDNQARQWRGFIRYCQKMGSWEGETCRGESWVVVWAQFKLADLAQKLVGKATAFKVFYSSASNARDTMVQAMQAGYKPTLCRKVAAQRKLGLVCEALGHEVYWI